MMLVKKMPLFSGLHFSVDC